MSAHSRQYRINFMLRQNLSNRLLVEWKQVHMICRHLIGHDGGGIGIDQHHFNAFLLQRTGSLGAGIVEFTGLADYDGTTTNNQYGFYGGIFWHLRELLRVED